MACQEVRENEAQSMTDFIEQLLKVSPGHPNNEPPD